LQTLNTNKLSQRSILVSILLGLFFGFTAKGQQKRKLIEYSGFFDSYYYRGPLNITIGGTAAGYIGDLGVLPNPSFSPGFNIGVSYKVWPRTYFGGEFNYLKIGSSTKDTSGNVVFTNTLYELIAFGRFNLIDRGILFKNDINRRPQRIRPYITLGVGAIYHSPKVAVTDTNFLKSYHSANSSNIAFVLPASLGFAFYISKRFSVLTEFGYRYAFTDGLDGISKLGTSTKDSYVTASLKLQYTILPFKKKRGKYIPPHEGSGGGGDGGAPIKKDSTLNDPILPPGAPIPPPTDSSAAPIAPPGTPEGQVAPAPEAPKELTEEEKKKKQEEEEQKAWEESAKPQKASPADKKKKTQQQDTGGW
jgi:hypothetical protein